MSDIHLTTPGATIGGRDPRKNFERALTHILRDHHDAELMVITGDLSDWGDRDDYQWLKAAPRPFPIPVRLCIGNHDNRATFLSVFPDLIAEKAVSCRASTTPPPARCLFLDTVQTARPTPAAICDDAARLAGGAARRA